MTQIAVLYPGAMGRAAAEALAPFGHSFVTHLAGRSQRTQDNCEASGIGVLASLEAAVDGAEMIVSVVPPDAAPVVAARCAAALTAVRPRRPGNHSPIFLDANSVSPATMAQIESNIRTAGASCVDGVFLGPSNPITSRTLLLLSGAEAPVAAEIFAPAVAVRIVGDRIGQASAVKMAMALMTKALVALFIEMACGAGKADCLDSTLQALRRVYPGVMEFLERTLPTYPRHAARRVVEMREAGAWLAQLGQRGAMTDAAANVLDALSRTELDHQTDDFNTLLRQIVARAPVSAGVPAIGPEAAQLG